MLIRPERPDDVDAIDRLTVAAFEPQWFSDGSEAGDPDVYGRMGFTGDGPLTHGDLDLSLVQQVTFSGPEPRGELRFAPAFDAAGHTASTAEVVTEATP